MLHLLCSVVGVLAQCPFGFDDTEGLSPHIPSSHVPVSHQATALDWMAVKSDIRRLLTDSQPSWPADFGHYGPLMIRLAWHCAGSYRSFDGRGGCDGARQRFDPERSWDDNTNLDKARNLLWPIKLKYGAALSWGDLIILTGTTAIESMGGPSLGFCGGRIDDPDGQWSELLGPTELQQTIYPCPINGQCKAPLGQSTLGLIYVNPEGPMGKPSPSDSALDIREVFGRMTMNDSETVSLIGGGHAFGKTHGACPLGPGPSPKDDPANPWPGRCGTGKGKDTFTSGFEGTWTTTPTAWSNQYFRNLLAHAWEVYIGPGGHHQWRPADQSANITMLTTDVALLNDPAGIYQSMVQKYAMNVGSLENDFAHSWYKLVTRDMGPVTRCLGPFVPPAQPFQYPLPSPPQNLPDFREVRDAITRVMWSPSSALAPDVVRGRPYYGAVFVHLAHQCASTFRRTDYLGGCNGARIRFPPQSLWKANTGMDKALQVLQPVKDLFGNSLTWADLIVLAGTVAIENATGMAVPFCGGRSDATDGSGSENLQPNGNYSKASTFETRENMALLGLSPREYVALRAAPRSSEQMKRMGYSDSWTADSSLLSSRFFLDLLSLSWTPNVSPGGLPEYSSSAGSFMVPVDLVLRFDAEFLAIAQDFAANQTELKLAFVSAWTKLMNNDRFDGPYGSKCRSYEPPKQDDFHIEWPHITAIIAVGATVLGLLCCLKALRNRKSRRTNAEVWLISEPEKI